MAMNLQRHSNPNGPTPMAIHKRRAAALTAVTSKNKGSLAVSAPQPKPSKCPRSATEHATGNGSSARRYMQHTLSSLQRTHEQCQRLEQQLQRRQRREQYRLSLLQSRFVSNRAHAVQNPPRLRPVLSTFCQRPSPLVWTAAGCSTTATGISRTRAKAATPVMVPWTNLPACSELAALASMPVILDKSDDDSIESAVDAQASHCTESSFSLAAPSGSAASTLASVVASVSPCPPKEVAAAQNRHALGFELDDDKMDTDDDEADMVPSYLFDAVVNGAT